MASPPERILITGGAGFIGRHTCLVLLEAGRRRVVELVGGDVAVSLGLQVVRCSKRPFQCSPHTPSGVANRLRAAGGSPR